jgi:hypothetical protein
MTKTEKLTLIDGLFTNEEVQEILMNILSNKIKFHERRNFSWQERFATDDPIAKARIPALENSIEQLNSILQTANKSQKINLNSEIVITYTADEA